MKINDITNILLEVSMKPGILAREAAKVNATVGIEFEMVVPDIIWSDDQQRDLDRDEDIEDIEQIRDFFGAQAIRFVRELRREYDDYVIEKIDEMWESEGKDYFERNAEDEFPEDEYIDKAIRKAKIKYGDSYEEGDEVDFIDDFKQEWIEEQWEEQGQLYDSIQEDFKNDQDPPDEKEFLEDEKGYSYLSDVPLDWPYYESFTEDITDLVSSFQRLTGKKAKVSKIHGDLERSSTDYIIEPDSSIKGNEGDAGLEFVSPPLSLAEMIKQLNRVIEFAKYNNCYTNKSTGLHINVSIPGYNVDDVDYVKLALLLGDDYILKQYGRLHNEYTHGVVSLVKTHLEQNPQYAKGLLDSMRKGLNDKVKRMIGFNISTKHVSINMQSNRIEFRSPGGDWLNKDVSMIVNTMLRFIVALDASMDPTKYKQEYLKKLYDLTIRYTGSKRPYFGQIFSSYIAKDISSLNMAKELLAITYGNLDKKLP